MAVRDYLVPQVCGHTFYDLVNFNCNSDCICRRAACMYGMSAVAAQYLCCHAMIATIRAQLLQSQLLYLCTHTRCFPNHTRCYCKSIMWSHSIHMIGDLGCIQSRQQYSWRCYHTCCKCHCSCQPLGLTGFAAILQGGSAAHACVVLSIMLSLEGCYVSGAASNHLVSSRATCTLQSFTLLLAHLCCRSCLL